MEEYKEIKGFEGLYEVSNEGNVRSLKRNIILNPIIVGSGYHHVCLCKDGNHYPKRINRLVAEAFIPNPDNLPCVNHKNEIKTDNRVENLEWCDYQYNCNYGTRNERIGRANAISQKGKKFSEETKRKLSESQINSSSKSKPVVAVKDGEVVMEFASTAEAERNGFVHSAVSKCCNKCFHRQGNNFYKDCYWYFKEDWEKIKMG